ncbi:CHASE2 domain-containing protein [Cupriavidus sp. H19C3]|uniref:CHASE2 domain-containing protein n=1 Tax=Cupriavidus sp. H19C3 TaxID=3241603 RepID=UPI003BF85F56
MAVPQARTDGQKRRAARTRFSVSLIFALLVSFTMLVGVPLLLPVDAGDAITHANARLQSALAGDFYPATHRDDTTVLLIDDDSVADTGQGWPLPYRTHARWLSVIGNAYKPRAVFVDITFTAPRQDDTLPRFIQALCQLRDRGIPVFLAALPGKDGKLTLRPGLESPPGELPCFKAVSVDYDPDGVDRLVWNYPLWREVPGSDGAGGTERTRSAALAMAEDVAGLRLTYEPNPMALVWGVRSPDVRHYATWCRPYVGMAELLPARLRAALSEGAEALKPICPYNHAITMRELKPSTVEEELRLRERLDGRIVLLGTWMAGTNDMLPSPVHGHIPGVFMHAMALDNLLTYGSKYKRALEWQLAWNTLVPLGFIVVALVHVVLARRDLSEALGWAPLRIRCPAWARPFIKRALRARDRAAKVGGVLGVTVLVLGSAWRIGYSAPLIMLFVVAAQRLLDIGMLPLVNLAIMALAAEWLGWTDKLTDRYLGRTAEPSSSVSSRNALE